MSATVALIVANDRGSGFGGSKYLYPLGPETMIEHVVANAAAWPVDEVVAVLGPDAEEIIESTDLGETTIVIDPEWAEGIAASLRVGIDVVRRQSTADCLVIGLGDQPGIQRGLVEELLKRSGSQNVVVPKYRYRRGWPVVVSNELWDRLLGFEGPVDLHAMLESHSGEVEEVWVDTLEPPRLLHPSDFPPGRSDG
ncbi:MAG: hypothetical protein BMS9Abin07_0762 [Acidimicrobiia bacterium]|nr:MAG: hypothetical protein BMS9Abin07_0762 [Acidimicrobiia bacterium]